MKNLFFIGFAGITLISCNPKETPKNISSVSEVSQKELSGNQIIESLDCSGCHSLNERMIGPSYQEISEKYSEKDIEILASKIIEGGSGVWGNVPMQPHPQVSKENAKKMVEFILSQKKQ